MADTNSSIRFLPAAAGLVAVLAVVIAVRSAFSIHESAQRLKEYSGYDAGARELEIVAGRSTAAIAMFAQLGAAQPAPLADLLKQSLGGQKYEIVEQASQPTIDGWIARRMEVTLPDVQFAQLGEFLAKAESQRPPWRLISCRIRATSQSGGKGQAWLTLEALDRA